MMVKWIFSGIILSYLLFLLVLLIASARQGGPDEGDLHEY